MHPFLNRIAQLIVKHLDGDLSVTEQAELHEWLDQSETHQALFEQLTDPGKVTAELERFYSYDPEPGWAKLASLFPLPESRRERPAFSLSWKRWAVAASLLLVAGAGTYFVEFRAKNRHADTTINYATPPPDVPAPHSLKATITLADGKKVTLDSTGAGMLAVQGTVNVTKDADGEIAYKAGKGQFMQDEYNTLSNPRGSKVVALALSDGTKVWLNAESSIHYPVAFTGNNRKVDITGEAYVEVTKDPARPFFVNSNGLTTEVIGTRFNINAYADESEISVTLLDGAVKVTKDNDVAILKPGQQAQVFRGIKIADDVDLDEVMAWKNGLFSFKGADLGTIMRQVSRWYDLKVEFKDTITEKFYGDISRTTNLSNLFKMLETTGEVHFTIEGEKVIVQNQTQLDK
jgi:transmembrane sensor